jgi:integrase
MTRRVRNAKIDSRAARMKHKPGSSPVWSDLGGKLHLGFRAGKRAGSWVARRYLGEGQYLTETIGEADGLAEADGAAVLSFDQAQIKARQWAAAQDAKERIAALGPVVTVAGAVREYLAPRGAAIGKLKHIIADKPLAQTPLASLTADELVKWRSRLLETMTESSARRVANGLRAALNAAAKRYRDKLPSTLRDVIKDGLAVPDGSKLENARKPQILNDADVRRLIDAAWQVDKDQDWGGDLARLIAGLAATGARFSQLTRCRVADLDVGRQRLMVPTSRKGRGEKKTTHTPIPIGGDVVEALEPIARGRMGTDPLFVRPRWRRVSGAGSFGVMEKYSREAWGEATTLVRPWRAIVKRAGLPGDLVVYCFRHSSIVRGLRAGLPTQLVARMHDRSGQMLEVAYTRFVASALEELARAALVPLMPAPVEEFPPLRAVERG